jgi:DNA-binding response OmpR family regulator
MDGPPPWRLSLGDVVIDFRTRHVISRGGRSVRLTPKEFNLLGYMVINANKVLTDRELLQAVWGPEFGTEHERLHVVIRQLRKKIEACPSCPANLVTVPRVGYQLRLPRLKYGTSRHSQSEP